MLRQACGFAHRAGMAGVLMRARGELRRVAVRSGLLAQGRKVDFMVCGTQKGGTTALYSYLGRHPGICMAARKELHFFDTDCFFPCSPDGYREYHSWFQPETSHSLLGEATPSYMYWDTAPKRIHEYNPEARLIVVLRNPAERAFSHWNMQRSKNRENLSFLDAVREEPRRIAKNDPVWKRMYSYVDRGFYMRQLRNIWRHFPREQVLVLKNDDLRSRPQDTVDRVCTFLGVAGIPGVEHRDVHSFSYEVRMSPEERKHLVDLYASDIMEVERELGWDCGDWLAV